MVSGSHSKRKKQTLPNYMWVDGKFVRKEKAKVSVLTHAIHYGTSVIEGIRAYWDSDNVNVFRLRDHLIRFKNSGKVYSISLGYSVDELEQAIVSLIKKNNIKQHGYIRPYYFVGEYGISLNVTEKAPIHTAVALFPVNDYFKGNGIRARISSWRRINSLSTPPLAKMGGNYLNSILTTQEAQSSGYDEGIMLDFDGHVSEAAGENIFVVRNDKVVTPPVDSSILEGITRDTVIKILNDQGFDFEQRRIERTELYIADEIFLVGTAAEVTPVVSLENKDVGNGTIGPITKKIRQSYFDAVLGKNRKYLNWLTPVY